MKIESTLPNMFIVLTAISLVSGAALAFTYGRTKPVLEELNRRKSVQAVAEVVDGFTNVPTDDAYILGDFPGLELYPAFAGGTDVGTAVRSYSPNGYGGPVEIMIGFDAAGAITGVSVLSHTETPGLGAKMTEPEFLNQFVGLDPGRAELAVTKDGGDIDALTAATISSRAFCEAAQRAWEAVQAGGGR